MEHQIAIIRRAVIDARDFQLQIARINLPGELHPVANFQPVTISGHLAEDARGAVGNPCVQLFLGHAFGVADQWQRALRINGKLREAREFLVSFVEAAEERERRDGNDAGDAIKHLQLSRGQGLC